MLKEVIIVIVLSILSFKVFPQTIVLYENFENGLGAFTSSGNTPWQPNDSIKYADSTAIHNAYTSNDTNILTLTAAINLSTYQSAVLEFYHIAKIEIADKAFVQISTDGGIKWINLDTAYYTGSGILLFDSLFFDGSYSEWKFNQNVMPDSSWWKKETFNLSSFTGNGFNNIKIRFKLISEDVFNWYGWVIDEFKIIATSSGEFDPPVITHTAIANTGSTNPITISATIVDASGLDSVDIYYRTDSIWKGPYTMTKSINDTFQYIISGQPQGNKVDYYIRAIDSSGFNNTAYHPQYAPTTYHTYEIIPSIFEFPYFENFETSTATTWQHKADLKTGNTGVNPEDYWELGTPAKTNFNAAYSGTKAYVTNLYGNYGSYSRSSLMSPLFDLSSAKQPTLTFYHKYDADYYDGARIDYTINDGFTWQVLGSYGDSSGKNWYNTSSVYSASSPVVRPGWSGNAGASFIKSSYNLSAFNTPGAFIRFRFVFTSEWGGGSNEGWIVDDIRITDLSDSAGILSEYNFLFLWQNYPNPAANSTKILYSIPQQGDVTLKIFDITGNLVYYSFTQNQTVGGHIETLDVKKFSNGIYLYQIHYLNYTKSRRMIISK